MLESSKYYERKGASRHRSRKYVVILNMVVKEGFTKEEESLGQRLEGGK